MMQRCAEDPSALRRTKDVDTIDGRPVRLVPLDPACNDHEVLPRRRDALMYAPEKRLRQLRHVARRWIDELAFHVHDVIGRAIESTDDQDLSVGERDRTRVCA